MKDFGVHNELPSATVRVWTLDFVYSIELVTVDAVRGAAENIDRACHM